MRPVGKRPLIVGSCALALGALGFWLWTSWSPPRVDMARYAPERSLAYLEITSLPELVEGLTETDAWRSLGPGLGLSSQLDYAGPVASLLGRLELGPDEAVALGRAQVAVVVTGFEAGPDGEAEGDAIVVRPRFAILLKTRVREATARELVAARLPMLARRAYGEGAAIDEGEYAGVRIATARPAEPGRQMVWAVRGDLVVIANHEEVVRAVLDTAGERAPALAGNFYLERLRQEVSADRATIFAFLSQPGVARVAGAGPGAMVGAIAGDPDRAASAARLVGGVSEGAVQALAYSGSFEDGRFVDRYFTVLTPAIADSVARAVRPVDAEPLALELVPARAADVTLLRFERPGEAFEALLTAVSSRVDVGVAAALTQIAIEARRAYGVEADRAVTPMLGDEVAFVDFGDGEPVVAIFEARDAAGLRGVVDRYLTKEASRVEPSTHAGVDVLGSTHEDGRAAAFVGSYLVLGTREQIARLLDARAAGEGGAEPLRAAVDGAPRAVLASQREDSRDAGELLLALSGALRASDGGVELLEEPHVREALRSLPPAVSVTEIRDGGVYSEARSPVGNLAYLTALL